MFSPPPLTRGRTWPPSSQPPAPSQGPFVPTRPVPAGSNKALPALPRLPPALSESGRGRAPVLQRPYRLAEAAAAASPQVCADRTGARPSGCAASGRGCGHGPLSGPPQLPHLALRLARASANRTDPLSLARAQTQYVAGGGRGRREQEKESVLSPRLTARGPIRDACAMAGTQGADPALACVGRSLCLLTG